MSDEDRKSFTEWLTPLLGLLVSAAAVLAVFVKITPVEIDTAAEYVISGLFVVFATCAGVAAWSHRHRQDNRRRTALFGALAVAALVSGVLLAVGTGGGASNTPSAEGSPTISAQAPTTGTSTTVQGGLEPDGSDPGDNDDGPTSNPTTAGGDSPATTNRPTGIAPNPTQPNGNEAPPTDDVRYQGEFRLSASKESLDLDPNPPEAYGEANELRAEDHAIFPVPPHTTGTPASGSPTRAECVEAVNRANPPAERFDDPQPGDAYCIRTSEGRYALVRVASAATKDFTLTLTVWN